MVFSPGSFEMNEFEKHSASTNQQPFMFSPIDNLKLILKKCTNIKYFEVLCLFNLINQN